MSPENQHREDKFLSRSHSRRRKGRTQKSQLCCRNPFWWEWGRVLEGSPRIPSWVSSQREQDGSRRSGWAIAVPWEGAFPEFLHAQGRGCQEKGNGSPPPIFYVPSSFLRTPEKGNFRPSNLCVCVGRGWRGRGDHTKTHCSLPGLEGRKAALSTSDTRRGRGGEGRDKIRR